MRFGKRKGNGKKGIVLSQLRLKLRIAYRNRDWKEVEYILRCLKNSVYIVDVKDDVSSAIIACLEEALNSRDWQKIEDLLQWLSDMDKNSPAYYRLIKGGRKRFTLNSIRKRNKLKKG